MKISTQMGYRHIKAFENAVRNHEMVGAAHPDDRDEIEERYERAKKTLRTFMIEAIIGE